MAHLGEYKATVVPPNAEELCPGVFRWEHPGSVVVLPHFWSDPAKASEAWLAEQREGMPLDGFEREILVNFESWEGKRVYPEYRDSLHLSRTSLRAHPNLPLYVGVDLPGPAAAVWGQLIPCRIGGRVVGHRVHILDCLLMDSTVEAFGYAMQETNSRLVGGEKGVAYVADPAAFFEGSSNDKRSAADVLRQRCGIRLRQGPQNIMERLEGVRRWLLATVPDVGDGQPPGAMLVDPAAEGVLTGFRGGYFYKEIRGTGRHREVPEKNCDSSHLMNALEYLCWPFRPNMIKDSKQKPLKWSKESVLGAMV